MYDGGGVLYVRSGGGRAVECVESVGGVFFFEQKAAYEVRLGLVGSGVCIRDRLNAVRDTIVAPEGTVHSTEVALVGIELIE